MSQPAHDPHVIAHPEQLAALFGVPGEASVKKEVPALHPHYQALIQASPFVALATAGPGGLDVSPRGDPAGFVVVENERSLLLPERRGNNRVDSLSNILADPRVALLFLIPGWGETLRVNGRAVISVDPALLERCAMQGKQPQCVLRIAVDTVFFQCARAIRRSGLWDAPDAEVLSRLPTAGAILEALTAASIDGAAYDRDLSARQMSSLY